MLGGLARLHAALAVGAACATTSLAQVESLTCGDVAADLSLFIGAVIDGRAFAKHAAALERASGRAAVAVLAGGGTDDSEGYFVQPTVMECTDPGHEVFTTEYFGPILAVHVYDDAGTRPTCSPRSTDVAPYALTGVDLRQRPGGHRDGGRRAAVRGRQLLHQRQADRGGRRAAAVRRRPGQRAPTTRPARSCNLIRWVSPRTIKETFVPPTDHRYPHMG